MNVAAADKFLLQPRYEAGKIYTIECVTHVTTGPAHTPLPEEPASHIVQTYRLQTETEPATGHLLVRGGITAIQASIQQDGVVYRYDSADPAQSPPALQQLFGAIKDKTFTLVYDRDSRFVETRDAAADDATPLAGQPTMNSKQLAEAFRLMQETALPDRPVGPGDDWTWQQTLALPPMPAVEFKGTSTLSTHQDLSSRNLLKVTFAGSLQNAAQQDASGMPPLRDATFKGQLHFNKDTSTVVLSEVASEFTLEVNGTELRTRQKETRLLLSVTDRS